MANLAVTAQNVRPLDGAVTRPFIAGGTLSLGDTFYISGYSGDKGVIQRADANVSAATARVRGLVVAIGAGKTTAASGDAVTGCVFGPVAGFSGLTPGAQGYQSDDAGKIEDAVGAFDRFVGYAEAPTVFFVAPVLSDAAS